MTNLSPFTYLNLNFFIFQRLIYHCLTLLKTKINIYLFYIYKNVCSSELELRVNIKDVILREKVYMLNFILRNFL